MTKTSGCNQTNHITRRYSPLRHSYHNIHNSFQQKQEQESVRQENTLRLDTTNTLCICHEHNINKWTSQLKISSWFCLSIFHIIFKTPPWLPCYGIFVTFYINFRGKIKQHFITIFKLSRPPPSSLNHSKTTASRACHCQGQVRGQHPSSFSIDKLWT